MASTVPNPHLSNWPSGTGSWAFYLAWFLQIALTITAVFVVVKLWTYRNVFPLTVAPVHIVGGSTLFMTTAVYSYLHPLITPGIPCWAHILAVQLTYVPTAAYGCTTHLHLWLKYRCQASMATGDLNNWFVRNRSLYEGHRLIIMGILFTTVVTMTFPLYRLSSRDAETLNLPMDDWRCTSMSTSEFVIKVVNGTFFVGISKRIAANLKEVQEAYPFRKLSQKVTSIVSIGYLFLEMPFWLKQFLTDGSLTRSIFDNLSWFCTFVWIGTYLLPYLYLMPIQLLLSAQRVRKRQDALRRTSSQVSGGSRDSKKEEESVRKVRNIKDLRTELVASKETQLQFKEYMVRELAVENMVFLMAMEDFNLKSQSSGGVAAAQDIVQNYITPNVTYEINISSSLRNNVLAAVRDAVTSSKDGTVPAGLFQKVEDEVYGMLLGPYNRFLYWCVQEEQKAESPPGGKGKVAPQSSSSLVSVKQRKG